MRTNTRTFPAAEIVPESYLAPIAFDEIFGRVAPVEVDLGCGDGTFLVALGQANPARDFVGVEKLVGRVRGATRKIGDRGLTNARILRAEILHAVQHHFAPKSVDAFHLMFPDPWPKRRHESRRSFNETFLRAVARALRVGGTLHVATDDAEYFAAMQTVAARATHLFHADESSARELPASTFEARFRERGLPIHRLSLRKV